MLLKVFCWWVFSLLYNLNAKKIILLSNGGSSDQSTLNFNAVFQILCFQMLCGSLTLFSLKPSRSSSTSSSSSYHLPSARKPANNIVDSPRSRLMSITPILVVITALHVMGNLLTLASMSLVSVSFTHTVKASEPLFTLIFNEFIIKRKGLKDHSNIDNAAPFSSSLIAILMVSFGTGLSSWNDARFNAYGFWLAIGSNVCFSIRNIMVKRSGQDSMTLFGQSSFLSLVPLALLSFIAGSYSSHSTSASSDPKMDVWMLLACGMTFLSYNLFSFALLGCFGPVIHSIINVAKRSAVIFGSALFFGHMISIWNGVGVCFVFCGIFLVAVMRPSIAGGEKTGGNINRLTYLLVLVSVPLTIYSLNERYHLHNPDHHIFHHANDETFSLSPAGIIGISNQQEFWKDLDRFERLENDLPVISPEYVRRVHQFGDLWRLPEQFADTVQPYNPMMQENCTYSRYLICPERSLFCVFHAVVCKAIPVMDTESIHQLALLSFGFSVQDSRKQLAFDPSDADRNFDILITKFMRTWVQDAGAKSSRDYGFGTLITIFQAVSDEQILSGTGNGGDAFGIHAVKKLINSNHLLFRLKGIYNVEACNDSVLLVAGSYIQLSHIVKLPVVWGPGLIAPVKFPINPVTKWIGIRGPRSREQLLIQHAINPAVVKDPGLLISHVFPMVKSKRYAVGFIPHYIDRGDFIKANPQFENVTINIMQPLNETIAQLSQFQTVISSSLHGVIFCHSYGIPVMPVRFSDKLAGGDFKFQDYYHSLGHYQFRKRVEADTVDLRADVTQISNQIRSYWQPEDIDTKALIESFPLKFE